MFGYTLQPYYTRRKGSPPPVIVEQDVRLGPHCPEVTKQTISPLHRTNVQSATVQSDDPVISVTLIRYSLSSLNFNIVLCVCVGGGVKEKRQLGRPRCKWKDNIKWLLVNDQLDPQFFPMCLFQFSTCFEQQRTHHQENQLYQYSIWYMSLCVGDCFVCRSESDTE